MTGRRTSDIGAQRALQGKPLNLQPQLRAWAADTLRLIVLSPDRDEQQEQRRWQDTQRRWRIAMGREVGNPADSANRSGVERLSADQYGKVFWSKRFHNSASEWQSNETSVLKFLGEADRSSTAKLRDHVAWMKEYSAGDKGSHLSNFLILDAGPNLDMWPGFGAARDVAPDDLPWPLFAQPLFLAAVVRQALVVLWNLAKVKVVHGDIKPANFCLALPADWRVADGIGEGRWDLRNLPLRAIDFELGYPPGSMRQPHVRKAGAVNESPYARACHLAAALPLATDHDKNDLLSGIDWGADLWALGLMLDEWCDQAEQFNTACVAAFREEWGVDSDAYEAAGRAVSSLAPPLGLLRRFAGHLQATERPLSDAGKRQLPARPELPHVPLRGQLEELFPRLISGTGDSIWHFTLIDPDPLLIDPETTFAEAAIPSPSLTAAPRLRQQGSALTTRITSASRRALALATRRPRRLVLLALLLGAPTLAWQARGDAHQATLQISQRWAPGPLRAFRSSGQSWQAYTGQAWLALAEALQPGQAAALTLAALGDAPVFDEHSPAIDPDALRKLRDASLRDLSQLARLPAPALAEPAAKALAERLLVAAYHTGTRLETTAPVPLGPGTDGAADALARLHQAQGFPLAALLQVHVLACHAPASRIGEAEPSLAALLALPAGTASRSYYLAFAQSARARSAAGQPACLPAAPGPSRHLTTAFTAPIP